MWRFYRLVDFIKNIPFDLKMDKQRMSKGYCDNDVWDLSAYFEKVIPNSIAELEDNCIGYPELAFEEVDKFDYDWILSQYSEIIESIKKNKYFDDIVSLEDITSNYSLDNGYIKYRLILRRIVWCFNESDEDISSQQNEYRDEYFDQLFPKDDKDMFKQSETEPNVFELNTNEVDKELDKNYHKRDKEIIKYRENMKKEGLKLFSKYFDCLWD